jgi:hypothetical protein
MLTKIISSSNLMARAVRLRELLRVQCRASMRTCSHLKIDVESVLQGIPQKVDAHMNGELCQPYADEEVKAAFF